MDNVVIVIYALINDNFEMYIFSSQTYKQGNIKNTRTYYFLFIKGIDNEQTVHKQN